MDKPYHGDVLYTQDIDETEKHLARIKRYKPKNWDPKQYELNVDTILALRELKQFYNTTGCYCANLARNDWDNIKPDSLLRPCSYCWKLLDQVMAYCEGAIDFEQMSKWVLRKRRFDNLQMMRILKMIGDFKVLYERDTNKSTTNPAA
jgi:hypothetical protein